jgi:surface antigen
MTRPDDETLMAYADGALDAATAAEIEAYIATDPEARETVDTFRGTGPLVHGAFDDALTAPLPPGLVELIRTGEPPAAKVLPLARPAPQPRGAADGGMQATGPNGHGGTADIVPFRRRRPPLVTSSIAALAACFTLVAGVAIGWRLSAVSPTGGDVLAVGPVSATSVLARVLETRPSYDYVTVANAGSDSTAVVAVATFRDRANRPCREFEVTAGADRRVTGVGVACRGGDGWTVEGVARTVAAAPTADGQVKPAGAEERPALDALVTMLGSKPALSKEDEAALIAGRWR